jgi:hypothetical protein
MRQTPRLSIGKCTSGMTSRTCYEEPAATDDSITGSASEVSREPERLQKQPTLRSVLPECFMARPPCRARSAVRERSAARADLR